MYHLQAPDAHLHSSSSIPPHQACSCHPFTDPPRLWVSILWVLRSSTMTSYPGVPSHLGDGWESFPGACEPGRHPAGRSGYFRAAASPSTPELLIQWIWMQLGQLIHFNPPGDFRLLASSGKTVAVVIWTPLPTPHSQHLLTFNATDPRHRPLYTPGQPEAPSPLLKSGVETWNSNQCLRAS